MKIENNKIIECTESELYEYWLQYWSDLMDFGTYMRKCKQHGTVIKENEEVNADADSN